MTPVPRTEERIAADAALTRAIEECRAAYGFAGLMGDWVVLYQEQELKDDGDIDHGYGILMRNGAVAATNCVGLLRVAMHDVLESEGRRT